MFISGIIHPHILCPPMCPSRFGQRPPRLDGVGWTATTQIFIQPNRKSQTTSSNLNRRTSHLIQNHGAHMNLNLQWICWRGSTKKWYHNWAGPSGNRQTWHIFFGQFIPVVPYLIPPAFCPGKSLNLKDVWLAVWLAVPAQNKKTQIQRPIGKFCTKIY